MYIFIYIYICVLAGNTSKVLESGSLSVLGHPMLSGETQSNGAHLKELLHCGCPHHFAAIGQVRVRGDKHKTNTYCGVSQEIPAGKLYPLNGRLVKIEKHRPPNALSKTSSATILGPKFVSKRLRLDRFHQLCVVRIDVELCPTEWQTIHSWASVWC